MIELFHPEPTKVEVLQAAEAVADSGRYSRGEQIEIFEKTLADSVGSKHAVALSSGTTALHAAIKGMGWGQGSKVLTSPYSFIATSNALLYEGCEPVFGQIEDNLQLDLDHAQEILETNPDIKGVLIPNIFGHRSDGEGLTRLRERFPHIGIVEDASQALATSDYGLDIGRFSDVVAYSFHENKVITTFGEGGAVTTDDKALADRIRSLRQHGRLDTPDWLQRIDLGYNYRLSEIQAAVGTYQLRRLPEILAKRCRFASLMSDELATTKLELPNPVLRSWFGFYVVTDNHAESQSLNEDLARQEIGSRVCPMPALTDFAHNQAFKSYDDQITNRARQVVMLPMHTRLAEHDVEKIIATVKSWASKKTSPTILKSAQFYDQLARQYEIVKGERSEYIDAVNDLAIRAIQLKKNGSGPELILDIGCGDGKRGLDIARATGCDLRAIDSSSLMVALARENGVLAETIDITKIQADKPYDAAMMLWNVLGHIESHLRKDSLRNVYDILSPNGLLILDVNNVLNETQYGKDSVSRNASAIADKLPNSGDFVTRRSIDGKTISTNTHIFHQQEISGLLENAGFEIDLISFINYSDGSITDENDGQIFIVARKGRRNT